MKKWLVFLFAAAFLFRLVGLDQSLWLDEAISANVAMQKGFGEIIRDFSPTDFHPPLYYLMLKAWVSLFGSSEISVRFPSIIFSLLAGWMVYRIGKKLKDTHFGLWASAFFLFNPLIVYYSQEARMYMMATFFIAASFYFLLSRRFFLSAVSAAVAFFTFYGALFYIGSAIVYFLIKKQYKKVLIFLSISIIGLIILSPLFYQQFIHAKIQLVAVSNWSMVLGKITLKNLLLIPLKFSIGRISFYPKTPYYLIAGLWTLIVFYFILQGGVKNKKIFFFFFMPIFLGVVFSLFTPLLQYFRFIYAIPLMSLLFVYATYKSPMRFVLLAGFVSAGAVYVFISAFHREDWKTLAKDVVKCKSVYMVYASSDAMKYYCKNIRIKDLSELMNVSEKEIMILPYSSDIYGIEYQRVLLNKKYGILHKKTYRRLVLETWQRK